MIITVLDILLYGQIFKSDIVADNYMTKQINVSKPQAETKEGNDFESDFGAILHHHSQTLMRLFLSLEPVMSYLGNNPFEGEVTTDEIDKALEKPVNLLIGSIEKIFSHVGSSWKERGFSEQFTEGLEDLSANLNRYRSATDKKFRPPFLQTLMSQLVQLFENDGRIKIAKELLKDVTYRAKEIQRLICLYEINNATIKILDMEQQTKALRDFYLSSVRVKEDAQALEISRLVKEAIRELEGYATAKRIRIDFIDNAGGARIKVTYKETLRALSNILHNAIKYNYTLKGNNLAWVKIETQSNDKMTFIKFENWGVPIEQDEIDSGLIFKAGWRGTYARLKDWSGNGIGLAEAKRSIENNKGAIYINSVPAISHGAKLDYTKPFITTVKVVFNRLMNE